MVAVESPGLWEKYSIKISDSQETSTRHGPSSMKTKNPGSLLHAQYVVAAGWVGSLTPPPRKMG